MKTRAEAVWRRMTRRPRFTIGATVVLLGASLAVIVALGGLPGCETDPPPVPTSDLPVEQVRTEPVVRIRVGRGVEAVNVASSNGFRLGPATASSAADMRSLTGAARIRYDGSRFVIETSGQSVNWAMPAMIIVPETGGHLTLDGSVYPGSIRLHVGDGVGEKPTSIDVVNHVPMETYLPGVLAKELYASWELEAYRAQAIAARSYAIRSLPGSRRRHYDMENTQASQAYIGATKNQTALDAVRQTRGIVLTTGGNVLRAYYSSACGGTGQDAAAIFPNEADVQPLRGTQHGNWCQESPYYRWTAVRDRATLSRRIAAWGKARGDAIGELQRIDSIAVAATNSVGRPTQFAVTDANGQSYTLGAESFRFACNHASDGLPGANLPALTREQIVRSSHVQVTVTGGRGGADFQSAVTIRGAGFGHGVGGCQYGMQAMAQRGYGAAGILAFYYPGAELRKAYE